MVPEARIVHRIAGRMRVRVPSRRGDAAYFATVEETLRGLNGVESVGADPLTGGILILHGIDPGVIVDYAAQKGLFLAKEEEAKKAGGTVLHDVLGAPFGSFSRRIRSFTGNAADLSGLAVLALLTVGVYQIARGNFGAPAWYTAFWYALGIFNKSDGGKEKTSDEQGGKGTVSLVRSR
jgi:hypothetical protein